MLFDKWLGSVLERSGYILAPVLLNIEIFLQSVSALGGGSVVGIITWKVALLFSKTCAASDCNLREHPQKQSISIGHKFNFYMTKLFF